ncbi:6467_t:CDS:2 [Paraglomus brasilianum]|uniref:6467_t:CDS:1 n=1 Tax=Paraglomus brasilianum TaxID=144538 RepID=A0A9N8VSX1_9GLOM|nr:6467_t:CDS:2 [Paraglomus brasilianum]
MSTPAETPETHSDENTEQLPSPSNCELHSSSPNSALSPLHSAASISNLINHDEWCSSPISTAPSSPQTNKRQLDTTADVETKRRRLQDSQLNIDDMDNKTSAKSTTKQKKPYIPRPPNSFILYRQHHHPLILNQNPGINNSEISRIVADHWKNLSEEEREEWKRKAEEAKESHMRAYPDYKYQPRRRAGPVIKNIKPRDTRESVMDNFLVEINAKTDRRSADIVSHRMASNQSVVIIERGAKELSHLRGAKQLPSEIIRSTINIPSIHRLPSFSRSPPQPLLSPLAPVASPTTTSAPSSSRGALIVLEGYEDGATTMQAAKLLEFLKNEGIKAKLWKFPDASTPAGEALTKHRQNNGHSQPRALHLLIAAHWWELVPTMREHLSNGITLIVDHYIYTAIASSAAAGLDINWCKSSYTNIPCPDLTFFLSTDRDKEAVDNGDIRMSNDWQRRVQDAFHDLFEVKWKLLDARKSAVLVHAQIIEASIDIIEQCKKSTPSNNSSGNDIRQSAAMPLKRHNQFPHPVQVQL